MALFGKKKGAAPKTPVAEKAKPAERPVPQALALGSEKSNLLLRPHVTEKATMLADRGVYVFEVHKNANKASIAEAIRTLYKVHPTRVSIVAGKRKMSRNAQTGAAMVKRYGAKKALITLKKGEKIEFA